jgi:hypothetical protein
MRGGFPLSLGLTRRLLPVTKLLLVWLPGVRVRREDLSPIPENWLKRKIAVQGRTAGPRLRGRGTQDELLMRPTGTLACWWISLPKTSRASASSGQSGWMLVLRNGVAREWEGRDSKTPPQLDPPSSSATPDSLAVSTSQGFSPRPCPDTSEDFGKCASQPRKVLASLTGSNQPLRSWAT